MMILDSGLLFWATLYTMSARFCVNFFAREAIYIHCKLVLNILCLICDVISYCNLLEATIKLK